MKKHIKNDYTQKIEALISDFPDKSENEQMEIINAIALAPDDTAWNCLNCLMEGYFKHPFSDSKIYKSLIELITDRAHLNFKFILLLYATCDSKSILQAAPLMEHILSRETDRKILLETIKTAGREHIEYLVPMISEFIYYDEQILKDNAVITLAEIGTEQAVQLIHQASQTIKNDRNIMATIALMNFESTPDRKNAFSSASPDIRNYLMNLAMLSASNFGHRKTAFDYFLKTGKKHASRLALNLNTDDKDLLISILKIFAATRPEAILPEMNDFLETETDPTILFNAFETLSAFDVNELRPFDFTRFMLKALEKNPSHLRMAAVCAIDKMNETSTFDIIKNKIETGRQKGEVLTQTIIDAGAYNIIDYLLISDTFTYMASNYLSANISSASLGGYVEVLEKRGLRSTAGRIRASAYQGSEPAQKSEALVISTSTTCIRMYEKILHSAGYAVLSFISPQKAFEHVSMNKPDLVLSDLFMGNMTAMELALEIREFYSRKELPIILFTSQNDDSIRTISEEYPQAEINMVLKFPGTAKQIMAAAASKS